MDDVLSVTLRSGELRCPICHEAFHNAVSTVCGHRFCKECLLKWIRQGGASCPECRSAFPASFNATYVRLMHPDLLVGEAVRQHFYKPCPHGCGVSVHPADTSTHVLTCPWMAKPCVNAEAGCTAVVVRKDMSEHLLACSHFPCFGSAVGCEFVGVVGALREHEASCHHNLTRRYVDARTRAPRPFRRIWPEQSSVFGLHERLDTLAGHLSRDLLAGSLTVVMPM